MSKASISIQRKASSLLTAGESLYSPKRIQKCIPFTLLLVNIYAQLAVIVVLGCGGPICPAFHAQDVFRNIFFSNFQIELLYACVVRLYVSVVQARKQRQAMTEKANDIEKGHTKESSSGNNEKTFFIEKDMESGYAKDDDDTAPTCFWAWFWASTVIWPVSLGAMIWTGYWMEVGQSFVEKGQGKMAA